MRFGKEVFTVLTIGLLGLGLANEARAQINLNSANTTYTQNFNSLSATATTSPYATFTNNSTIPGLYARQFGGGAGSTPSVYRSDNGAVTAAALYSYGATGDTERALGSLGSAASTGGFMYGFRFVNNDASATLTSLAIQYDGEQWRNSGNTAAQRLRFSYAVFSSGTGDIGNETSATTSGYTMDSRYTADTALDFSSPVTGGTASALNGNSVMLQKSDTLTGLSATSGKEIWVRVVDIADDGSNHGLAIDNFSVTATFTPAANTPEPPSLVLLSGVGLVLGALRQRSRLRK